MDLVELSKAVGGLPLAVLLVLLLVGGYRRWWVFGWAFTEAELRHRQELQASEERSRALLLASKQREDEWRQLALEGRGLASSAVELARTKARQ
jgi:hypothetical protein